MKKILLSIIAMMVGIIAQADVVDVINVSMTGATSTTYVDFSDAKASSAALYAGNNACTKDKSIQCRSKNSNSGIVSTKSGGKLKKVVINWDKSNVYTPTGDKPQIRYVQVYGSNTAYKSAANLYSIDTNEIGAGDKLGEVMFDGENLTATIEVSGDYQYVGIRSKDGTIYLTSIEITWDGEATGGEDKDPEKGDDPEPTPLTHLSVADFLSKADTNTAYELTGVVSNITNKTYGNFDLVDNGSKVYIYGLLNLDGEAQKFESLDIAENDTVTLSGTYFLYTPKEGDPIVEIKNAQYISHKKYEAPAADCPDPTITVNGANVTITVEGAYDIIYTLDGNEPADGVGTYVSGNKATFTIPAGSTTIKAIAVDPSDPDLTSNVVTKDAEVITTYNSIAELKANTTATSADKAEESAFAFDKLTVTGVYGSYVFVTDGTEGYLLFGSKSGLAKGDVISGYVKGKAYLYNDQNEMTVSDWSTITKAETKATVEPIDIKIADVLTAEGMKKYESMYVRFTDVTFEQEAFKSKSNTLKQGDNTVTIYNTANITDVTNAVFSLTQNYNVNVFVAIRKGACQVYPMEAVFYDYISHLASAESAWTMNDEAADKCFVKGDYATAVNAIAFTTKSDATPAFESSNENVATVDANGKITIIGAGIANITATTKETAQYEASNSIVSIYVYSDAQGTQTSPYLPSDVIIAFIENGGEKMNDVWVKGTIAGNAATSKDGIKAEIKVAESAETADAANIALEANGYAIPVQLVQNTPIREALNIKDNFGNVGKETVVCGNIEKYFGAAGLKSPSDAYLDGMSVGINGVAADAVSTSIYNLNGQKLSAPQKGINIIGGKKVLVK